MRALMRRWPCSPLVCPLVCLALSAALAPACAPHATTPPPLAHTPAPGPAGLAPAPKASPDAAPKWDVNDPPGAETDVAIDVREGTWMSLDVSPDGAEIVFDLLGDLYTVPIGGGEARVGQYGYAASNFK